VLVIGVQINTVLVIGEWGTHCVSDRGAGKHYVSDRGVR